MSNNNTPTQPATGGSDIPDSYYVGYSDCYADKWNHERVKQYSADDQDAYGAGWEQCSNDERTGRCAYQINYEDE